jgi:DNA polymerase-3 subunit epsilon
MPHGTHPHGWVDALLATAETVDAGYGPVPAATAEETECLLRWLDTPGLRMVRGAWSSPLESGARHLDFLAVAGVPGRGRQDLRG